MPLDAPVVAYEDDACMVATWRSIVMPVMGKGKLPTRSADAQVRALLQHGTRVGLGRLAEITLISEQTQLPESETRQVLEAAVPLVTPYYACVAAIFEGEGFRAALVRGFLTSLQLLSRAKFPQKTFSSVDECAAWMLPHLKPLRMSIVTAPDVVEVVKAVRALSVARGIL
jgi:hypothetical protein